MSWICKFQVGDRCKRCKKPCTPGMKGCVLNGKYAFITPEGKTKAKRHRRRRKGEVDSEE